MLVPFHLTAGVWTLDERAPKAMHTGRPSPGAIFIKTGHKHTGLVEAIAADGSLVTIEGNTDPGGHAEGDGVYRRTRQRTEIKLYLDVSLLDVLGPEENA